MFWLNVWYQIKMMIKQKDVLIWLLFFPLILSTIFHFALGGISTTATYEKCDIAVIGAEQNQGFYAMLSAMSDIDGEVGEEDMFSVIDCSDEAMAQAELKEGKIKAVILYKDGTFSMLSNGLDVEGTVIKTMLDSYVANEATITNIVKNGGDMNEAMGILRNDIQIAERSISKNAVKQSSNYFYALLGMTCFYFSLAGKEIIRMTQANQSVQAQRQSLAPIPRVKIFASVYLGNLLCSIIIIAVLLFYLTVVLGVGLGNIFYVFISCIVGIITALGLGMLIGSVTPKNSNVKDTILLLTTMLLSVLSGLMGDGLKNIIVEKANFINYINPVALIADSFHSLYFYNSLAEFGIRIAILCAYAVVFTGVTMLLIRRKKYAYI